MVVSLLHRKNNCRKLFAAIFANKKWKSCPDMLKATWDTNTPTMATYFQYWWVHCPSPRRSSDFDYLVMGVMRCAKSYFNLWSGQIVLLWLLSAKEAPISVFFLMILIDTCQILSTEISNFVPLRAFGVFPSSAFFCFWFAYLVGLFISCVALVDCGSGSGTRCLLAPLSGIRDR
jgi:hypothetical protein